MSEKPDRSLDRASSKKEGFFNELYKNLRLIVRLLKDSRVNPILKVLPIGALIYLLLPTDFLPLNPIDDGLVLWLGATLFIELCPNDVVDEHRKALNQTTVQSVDMGKSSSEVIDAEYKEIPPQK
ncbi:MAG: hypothetical protein ACK2TV_02355 [Anaerolineales bacterium]|jgi:uncharacterized membrane protein YkvA (DUF1232 family)